MKASLRHNGIQSQVDASGLPSGGAVYQMWDPEFGDMTFNITGSGGHGRHGDSTWTNRTSDGLYHSGNESPGDEAMYGPMDDDDYLYTSEDLINNIRATFFLHKQTETAILICLYSIVFTVGLIGNVLVIYVFTKDRKMRTVTNSFLVNLAVCDLMVVCMCMPFSVALEIYANWIYGDAMCKIVTFVQGLSVISSILTLTVISTERFYAIRKPLRARAFMSRRRIQTIIGIIWIVSGIVVLPTVFVRQEKLVDKIFSFKIKQCVEHWGVDSLKHVYNFALLFTIYMGPAVFICVGYLSIRMHLLRTDTFLHASNGAAESENARANFNSRRRVARMLFVLAILFAVSWLPYHVMSILMDFMPEKYLNQYGQMLGNVHSYALWLGHTNSSINPICYCIMSSSFKGALRVHFRMCCCCSTRRNYPRDSRRESFKSLSMAMTMSTTTSSSSKNHHHATSRVVYKPIVGRTNSTSPDLLENTPRITIQRCEDV